MTATLCWRWLDAVGFRVIQVLLSVLWQSSIVLSATALLLLILRRRRASVRHAVCTTALLLAPLVPLFGWAVMHAGAPHTEVRVIPTYTPPSPVMTMTTAPAAPAPSVEPLPVEPIKPPPEPREAPFSLADYPRGIALQIGFE